MSDSEIARLLRQGIDAAKAGHVERARQALSQAIELDEHNEQAWLWLSGLADDAWDRYFCLENVLKINPNNGRARAGLRFIEQQVLLGEPKDSALRGVAHGDPGLVGGSGPNDARQRQHHRRKQRWLWATLSILVVSLVGVFGLFVRYVYRPTPLPELLPLPVRVSYPPHYLFSIYGAAKPVGVALSPGEDRIYVAESAGERMVRIFDRSGEAIGSFAPPRTNAGERTPVYLSTDSLGQVFVTDRLQHAVLIYDGEGGYLDTILAPDLTLSEYVDSHIADFGPGTRFAYNRFQPDVYYVQASNIERPLPAPGPTAWSPLGLRIDGDDRMLLTDILGNRHVVREIPATAVRSGSWVNSHPSQHVFGEAETGNGQLLFPNVAVRDSAGRIYVTDGNNGRIAVWSSQGGFILSFGQGTGEGGLSLPRGAAIDSRDRLYIVDAVGQKVVVYDVSGKVPSYLFAFGEGGLDDGQFNYPNDIALDAGGRLYIADRENDRIQVWSY
jgi:DNA-binding beta-propeller fold protein YncE